MDFFTLLFYIILYGFFIAIACILLISVTTYLVTDPYPIVERYKDEETFKNHHTKSASKFPSMDDPHSVHLSVVVPAYNEEERLSPMLDEALKFFEERLNQHPAYKYEIIVVSDGSQDKTVEVAESYAEKFGSDKVRCLQLVKNRGKGGAVRLGVQSSRGAIILFADADGATKFEDVQKLEEALKRVVKHDYVKEPAAVADARALVVGSRAHLEEESLANRSVFRNILMFGFHFLVWFFTVKGIKDTQCGFKLFTRKSAQTCFRSLHVNRWAFDVELLYIAQKLNIPIEEIPVRWTEIEGSKVTPVLSWIQMGCDLGLIWLKYTTGAWKIKCEKID